MPFPPPPPPSGHPPPPHGPHKRLGGDPYLQYQPHFAFSLPVQILCNGMILTLAGVLLIHLVLTAQYHWALARVNYLFQLSAICMLCINVIASTIVVFATVHSDSRTWPYMLDYIAVTVPVNSWSLTEKILWYTLEAVTSGLAHITHIQFLTLMYPSKLEARLIFILLGPLAVASSAMQYCSLSPHQTAQDLGDAIRGICNTTLALLFTAALFIWGFIVNRKRAWRTDGGTAVFGASAIILAIMSIVINFILVFMDEMLWLPSLLWAVVMWQYVPLTIHSLLLFFLSKNPATPAQWY
ncbi:hypothetical protein DL93DRAFT_2079544 [Clavulina sp. PMI_390]|nr:hypothetical protein DL93DRAFT_2079544 [Clavulina sp. PMI_390]